MADNIATITVGNSNTLVSGTLELDYTTGTLLPGSALDLDVGGTETPLSDLAVTTDPNGTATTVTGVNALGTGVSLQYQGVLPSSVATTVTAAGQPAVTENIAATSAIVCFATGTLVRTARGEIAVEDLVIGDLAVTVSGEFRPIRWLGQRRIDCRQHAEPQSAMPVRIARDAFGPDRPFADLRVSPGHAICVEVLGELLIPAGALCNGATIAQEVADEVTYWHVELDSHDVILANGLAAESYMDCGNRSFFSAGAGPVDPERTAATTADYCRPFLATGGIVDAVRERLASRATALGWKPEETVDAPYVLVDGRRLEPLAEGNAFRFHLPGGTADAWLCSETFVPAWRGGADWRQLGICLASLHVTDGLALDKRIALDAPALADCLYACEGEEGSSWRWTDGRARLPASLWAAAKGDVFLRVTTTSAGAWRWIAPSSAQAESAVAAPRNVVPIRKLA